MLLTEAERTKMLEEFAIRFGGAMLGALEDTALEGYWKAGQPGTIGQFPFMQLHPKLLPTDDIIVGGLAIPPWVIGALMEEDGKKRADIRAAEMGKNLKMLGEGNVCYSLNMVLHHEMAWAAEPPIYAPAKKVGVRRASGTGEKRKTDVGHKVIKL